MNDQEKVYLNICRQQVEKKLDWGSAEEWTNLDFINLSEMIFHLTGVNLSTTTLKRIWGRVKYDSSPNTSTLNVLAQFAGDHDWRSFKINCQKNAVHHHIISRDKPVKFKLTPEYATPEHVIRNHNYDRKTVISAFTISLMLFIFASTILALLLSWQAQQHTMRALSKQKYAFSAETVTTGLPNTVIFDYDASAAPNDQIYIQQANLQGQKTRISRNEHRFTSMFYYPGAYQAQLLVEDTIVGQQDFQINTQGWLAMVEQDPMPLYYQENIRNQGKLGLPLKTLEHSALDLQLNVPWVSYYNVQDFGELYADNFILQTAIKSEFKQGNAICQDSSVIILFQNSPSLHIPLSIPGCLAQTDKLLKDQGLQPENINLLAFGTDFSDWIEVKCESNNHTFKVHINDNIAYEGKWNEMKSKVIGVAYKFHGTGSVDYVRLSKPNGQLVFYDDFS